MWLAYEKFEDIRRWRLKDGQYNGHKKKDKKQSSTKNYAGNYRLSNTNHIKNRRVSISWSTGSIHRVTKVNNQVINHNDKKLELTADTEHIGDYLWHISCLEAVKF
jgi:hypothetical protein